MTIKNRTLRDHPPITIEEFNGQWDRGGEEAVPPDHFDQCTNLKYIQGGFETRDGLATFIFPSVATNIIRTYLYKMQDGESLLQMNTSGEIFHSLLDGSGTTTLILTIAAADDFGFVEISGFAYISPFENYNDNDGRTRQRGISGEFLYVYLGAAVTARKAAGPPPTGSAMSVSESSGSGFSDRGFHLFAVVYETDTGFLTAPGPETFTGSTSVNTAKGFDITGVLTGPSPVAKRHIVATKVITNYNQDQDGFQFFFVPEGNIDNNVGTTISVNFFDIDLLDDASHLIDNFSEIAAGVTLAKYNSRLALSAEFNNESLVRVSHAGEPEAISQVDGLIIVPPNGLPITNMQEYRDILYIFKQTMTWASVDNLDVPASWSGPEVVDNGIGASVHGIGTVLDSGAANIEALFIADFSGIMIFNGRYQRPELSWKIQNFWLNIDQNSYHFIHMINDTINQLLYLTLPDTNSGADHTMLVGDYSNGMNAKDIKWCIWDFAASIRSIAIVLGISDPQLILSSVTGGGEGAPVGGTYQQVIGRTNDQVYDTSTTAVNQAIPTPLFRTAFFTGGAAGELINHYTGVRMRVVGSGNLDMTLFSPDSVNSNALTATVMASTSRVFPFTLANFIEYRAQLQGSVNAIDEEFRINRILLYAKPVFTMEPA